VLAEQGTGQRFRLRVEGSPDTANVPIGLLLVDNQTGWWRVQVQPGNPDGPAALWGELWRRGWRILEIRSEASSLEELYLNITAPASPHLKEAA
jgi:ABC-2 type transport system ATP-binding protein